MIRKGLASDRSSIRARLGLAMALALLPVLLLGLIEGWAAYNKAGQERRHVLGSATTWAASVARDRLGEATTMLSAASRRVGQDCQGSLEDLAAFHRFSELVRIDAGGQVRCSVGVHVDAHLWRDLAPQLAAGAGAAQAVVREPVPDPRMQYRVAPPSHSIVTAVSVRNAQGGYDGALVGVMRTTDLLNNLRSRDEQAAELALADTTGSYLARTNPDAFPAKLHGWSGDWGEQVPHLSEQVDGKGQARVYSTAPLLGRDLFLVLSTPTPGLFSWARLNILSSILLPLAAFAAALTAVWLVTERVVVRWLHYVERIAAIYAKGRFTVRPLRADKAPAEIRGLAHTLDDMADTIVARDLSLRDSLAQKDAMMREIHHRVKNNLQVITSLLNMQQRSLTDPAARAAMTDTRQRISALALIYRALYQGPDLKRVDLRHFLEELLAQIISSEARHGPSIRTELDADDLIIDPDKLAPLALFAVEAVTSAQKHAFAEHGGTLRVRFKVEGDDARLEIADDVPVEARSVEGPQSVGQVLMTAFARQLRGKAEFGRNLWGGSTTSLVFPTPEAPQAMDAATQNG